MQQRRVRLGDILDDYCPRERRVTNHVVAAMVGDDVKHTRCTTCDVDHEYKHARVPPARKKKDGVLAALPGDAGHLRPPVTSDPPDDGLPDQTDVLDTLDETAAVVTVAANSRMTPRVPGLKFARSVRGSGLFPGIARCMSAAGTSQLTNDGKKRTKNSKNESLPLCHTIRVVMSPKGEKAPPALAATTMLMQASATNRVE